MLFGMDPLAGMVGKVSVCSFFRETGFALGVFFEFRDDGFARCGCAFVARGFFFVGIWEEGGGCRVAGGLCVRI